MLEFDVALYPMERDEMLFAKQYLVYNAATAWDQFRTVHPKANYSFVAMKELLYSWVILTKYFTDAAF